MADTVVQELVINTLTQAQFDAAKEAGTLSPYELYGTPDTSIEMFNGKADVDLNNTTNGAKELMANASMPSGTYKDLTLGTTGTKYTAPADGWFFVSKKSSGNGQYLTIGNDTANFAVSNSQGSGANVILYLPASAGDVVNVSYNVGGTTNSFRFIYANGAKHLA